MYFVTHITFLLVLLFNLNSCDYSTYRYYPLVGECFQIYSKDETVTPLSCQKPLNIKRQACVEWLPDENACFQLKTPTGEIVKLLCPSIPGRINPSEIKNCFEVSKRGRDTVTVCQKVIDSNAVGLTTPDNFTILLDSKFCSTSNIPVERKEHEDFVKDFKFDPEIRSCHKVYREGQDISPWTCLNDDVHDSCVHQIAGNEKCSGITTPNKETVIFQCSDGSHQLPQPDCFRVYNSDNVESTSCIKKLEERCMGFTTPSNLTVLLECVFCSAQHKQSSHYNVEEQRKKRKFVKATLARGTYLDKNRFDVFHNYEQIERPCWDDVREFAYGYWVPGTNCYGLKLEGFKGMYYFNETIILECLDSKEEKGCFRISSPASNVTRVCQKPLTEDCVGFRTPEGESVIFGCYKEYTCVQTFSKVRFDPDDADYKQITPEINNCYRIYGPDEGIPSNICSSKAEPEKYACIEWLPGGQDKTCAALKFPSNETIEFLCGRTQKKAFSYRNIRKIENCFNIRLNGHAKKVCQRSFGDYTIGITTPKNYTMLFTNVFCTTFKTTKQIETYKNFVQDFVFDPNVRTCYKVYTPDQIVTPTSCLSEEIHDSCIHQLKQDPNCEGITTQNKETIVLNCKGDDNKHQPGCFKIYTAKNEVVTSCQEQVEESCVGIRTPSNLTVLLECLECNSTKIGETLPPYTDEYRRSFRGFVKSTLDRFAVGNYSFPTWHYYRIYQPHQAIKEKICHFEVSKYKVHTLYGHENCVGLTTEKLETVVLQCPHKKPEKPGCFDVYGPNYGSDNKIVGPDKFQKRVCAQVILERCVGIVLPSNWTIPFVCAQRKHPTPC